jgi:predicted site-specific integrase-resolvase
MENTHTKKQLSTKEAAKELDITIQTLLFHYKKGRIKAHVLLNGKYLLFDADVVAEFKQSYKFRAKKGGTNNG